MGIRAIGPGSWGTLAKHARYGGAFPTHAHSRRGEGGNHGLLVCEVVVCSIVAPADPESLYIYIYSRVSPHWDGPEIKAACHTKSCATRALDA